MIKHPLCHHNSGSSELTCTLYPLFGTVQATLLKHATNNETKYLPVGIAVSNLSNIFTKIKNMKSISSALIAVVFIAASCNTTTPVTVEIPAPAGLNMDSIKLEIAASNKLYDDAFVKGDSALFIGRYTDDACIMPSNMPALCGTAGIAGFYNAAYNMMGVRHLVLTTKEVYGADEYLTEEGSYELMGANNTALDKGKFLVLWKKTGAGWKMHRDIFNSDNPAAPTAK